MYLERLKGLQARLHAYQEQTKNLEIMWRSPVPVPTVQRSRAYDYYFSFGLFEVEEGSGARISIFIKNPNRLPDLRDPQCLMLINAPYGTLEDMIVIFQSHISEKDMGRIAGTKVCIIKGVVPEIPGVAKDAESFNFSLNRELMKLFLLSVQSAQTNALLQTNLDLGWLEETRLVH